MREDLVQLRRAALHLMRRGLVLALLCPPVLLCWADSIAALPVQYRSVDLFNQAQSRLDGLAGSHAGQALATLAGTGASGRDALAIGMPESGPAGRPQAGAVAVLRGAAHLGRVVDLSALNGRNGFAVFGAQAGDEAGFALASIPRAHRTPLLAIGCPYAAARGRAYAGVVYLIDPARVHSAAVDLAHPRAALVGLILGPAGSEAGYALAGGQLAPSGGDLFVGAPAAAGLNGSYAGAGYLVFGARRPSVIDLAHPGHAVTKVLGPGPDAGLGSAVAITPAAYGPVRAWIGAPTASPLGRSLAGSVFGLRQLRRGSAVNTARGIAGVTLDGARPGDGLGNAIAALAPTAWRRRGLIALGASGASPRARQSAGEIVLSSFLPRRSAIDLGRPRPPVTIIAGAHPYDGAGYSLAAVRDPVTGANALAIGAPFVGASGGGRDPADAESVGAAYVVGGSPSLPADLGRVGSAGVTVTGARADDQAGTTLADGWLSGAHPERDLLIGAPFAQIADGNVGGAAYLVAGVPGR